MKKGCGGAEVGKDLEGRSGNSGSRKTLSTEAVGRLVELGRVGTGRRAD